MLIASRWSQQGLGFVTWEGGGTLSPLETGPATTALKDNGAGQSIARCPDSNTMAGSVAAFRVDAPARESPTRAQPPDW